jgi:SsrA-binding protein
MAKRKENRIDIRNKKATFDYELIEHFTAGIVLSGSEIKSIRAGKASLVDSYCYFVENELFVKNMHIAEYWWGSAFSRQDPKRDRKLLLTKKELRKLRRATREKGIIDAFLHFRVGALNSIEFNSVAKFARSHR